MKNLIQTILASLFIAPIAQALPITTPAEIRPQVSVSDQKAIHKYLQSLVEDYEFVPPNDVDLVFSFENQGQICRNEGNQFLICTFTYTANQWNGLVVAELKIENARAVELKAIKFGGHY